MLIASVIDVLTLHLVTFAFFKSNPFTDLAHVRDSVVAPSDINFIVTDEVHSSLNRVFTVIGVSCIHIDSCSVIS